MVDWDLQGGALIYATSMESGRQRYNQLFRVSVEGGLPEKLSVPYAEFGALSPDGKWLAFMFQSRDSRTWKRYRGGWAPDIWLFNLEDKSSRNVTQSAANDSHPMGYGERLYFLSDRGEEQRYNLWSVDLNTGVFRQVTRFTEFDLHFPAIGPAEIVFEAGEDLYLLDLASERTRKVEVQVVTDRRTVKPSAAKVSRLIQNMAISPTGKRALFEARGEILSLPAEHGAILNLSKGSLHYWDLKEHKEETVLEAVDEALLSADGKKLLGRHNQDYAILDLKPKQKIDKKLRTADLEVEVDPRAEWKQMFADAWRLQRDYFYDPHLHGVDWDKRRRHYEELLEDAVTRWDVNFVTGELIAELNASHTYRSGGETERLRERKVGLLGIDWSLENGAYRIRRIVRGAPWDAEVRSPLEEPGVGVREGEYILAVNGVPLDVSRDPWSSFQGLAGETVVLTVHREPTREGAREVVVKTLESEERLRHFDWVEANRRYVEKASNGRIGYIYVPNTGREGQTELVRMFGTQIHKEGLIIDERFNSGGQIPGRFVELLHRPALSYWAVRDGRDWQWPPVAHYGPKVMLINGWSGSGGDAFPYYFKKAGLGPLIGSRTWGGLIGISGAPGLIDGGVVTVPTFRMYLTAGRWFAEGHGADPDIPVPEDPTALAQGKDPQLDRAIQRDPAPAGREPAAASGPPYEKR